MQFNGFALTETFTVANPAATKSFAYGYQPSAIRMAVISGTNKGAELTWNDKMPVGSAFLRSVSGVATVPLSNGITLTDALAVDDAAAANLEANILTLNATPSTTQYSKGFTLGVLTGFSDTAGDVIVVESFRAAH